MSLIRKHGAVLQAWACLDLVLSRTAQISLELHFCVELHTKQSPVVLNVVVRATFKVNGKPQIFGNCNPLTPKVIELKFDRGDDVGGVTPRAKNCKSRSRRGSLHGKGVNYNVQTRVIFRPPVSLR